MLNLSNSSKTAQAPVPAIPLNILPMLSSVINWVELNNGHWKPTVRAKSLQVSVLPHPGGPSNELAKLRHLAAINVMKHRLVAGVNTSLELVPC